MEEPTNLNDGNKKWQSRLALFFLLLFALLWSLGSFFFWTLLGLSAVFGYLAFYSSGIKISIFNRPDLPAIPNRSYSTTENTSAPQNQLILFRKIIRAAVIGFVVILVFLFVVGIFAEKDTDTPGETVEVNTSDPISTDAVTLYTDKGNDFFNQAQYDSALTYYEKVLAIDPENQYGLYNKALVYYMTKSYRKSISIVKKCLRKNPEYNEAWWLLGDDYSSINNYDSAAACLEKAYSNDYSDPSFLQTMADVYLKKGDRKKAKEFYLKVIEQDTTKPDVYRQLAELDPGNADQYRKKANALGQSPK